MYWAQEQRFSAQFVFFSMTSRWSCELFFSTKWPFPTKWLATGEQFISTGAQWTNFNNLGLILHAVQLITYMKLQILRFFFVTNDCHAYIIFFFSQFKLNNWLLLINYWGVFKRMTLYTIIHSTLIFKKNEHLLSMTK